MWIVSLGIKRDYLILEGLGDLLRIAGGGLYVRIQTLETPESSAQRTIFGKDFHPWRVYFRLPPGDAGVLRGDDEEFDTGCCPKA